MTNSSVPFSRIVQELFSYDPIGEGSIPLNGGEYELGVVDYGCRTAIIRGAPSLDLEGDIRRMFDRPDPSWADLGLDDSQVA